MTSTHDRWLSKKDEVLQGATMLPDNFTVIEASKAMPQIHKKMIIHCLNQLVRDGKLTKIRDCRVYYRVVQ